MEMQRFRRMGLLGILGAIVRAKNDGDNFMLNLAKSAYMGGYSPGAPGLQRPSHHVRPGRR